MLGPGGIGKTRLTLELARALAPQFEDGAIFVQLDAVPDPEAVPLAIADALRFQPGSGEPTEQLAEFLRERELLLVLDNFEHVTAAAPVITALLSAATGLRCLVTSREVLNLQEEWTFPLEGMGVPGEADREDLERFAAVQLFAERVRQVRPELDIEAQAEPIARICRLVEGMPLGLELAASWARYMDCEAIAAEVERSIDFLSTTLRNVPERHRGLQAVFDQSWKLLDDEEQSALARCSVFHGGFTREAAAEVAGASLPVLAGLVNKSLVRQGDQGRYSVHALVRQFARLRLDEDAEALAAAQRAHRDYFMRFVADRLPALDGGDQVGATEEMARDLANVRVAWMGALEERELELAPLVGAAWHRYYQHRSAYLESVALFEASAQLLDGVAPSVEATRTRVNVLTGLAWFLLRTGRLEEVESAAQEAVELAADDPDAIPGSLGADPQNALGVLAMTRGDFDEASRLAEAAIARAEAAPDSYNLALALYVLVTALSGRGDYTTAQTHAQRALEVTAQTGDRWFSAYVLNELGTVALALGDLDAARKHFRASYDARQPFEDHQGMALALGHLGEIALTQGRADDAERDYRESLAHYRDVGDRGGLAAAQCGLGRVATAKGDYASARERFLHALDAAAEMRFVPLIFETLCDIGELLVASGESEAAAEVLGFVESHPQVQHAVQARAQELLEQAGAPKGRSKRGSLPDLDAMLAAVRSGLAHDRSGGEAWRPESVAPAEADALTARELEVLQLIASGSTNAQIAKRLGISVGTAKWYSSQILGKLSVRNRNQAVARARELGIIP